jgi:hypothetical protein
VRFIPLVTPLVVLATACQSIGAPADFQDSGSQGMPGQSSSTPDASLPGPVDAGIKPEPFPAPTGSCPVAGKTFAYQGNGTTGPYPMTVFATADNPVYFLSAGRPEIDDSVWIAGNGDWVKGDGDTFQTISTLAATIGEGGGWRQVPNTAIASLFPSDDLYMRIFGKWAADVKQRDGPAGLFFNWGGGTFDGRSFLVGAGGGHNGYAGTELYRIRLTDPPQAVRMFDPVPAEAVARAQCTSSTMTCPLGDNVWPEYGPRAAHTYDSWRWSEVSQTFFWGGSNMAQPNMGKG